MTTTADSTTARPDDDAAPATGGQHQQEHHEHRHAAPRAGAYSRFRDSYEKLPPGVQLIGLQLWLPFFFVIAFCFCYVLAFHAPAPKDLPVAIVGSSSQTTQAASALQTQTKGEFSVSTVPTVARAHADVKDGTLAAAYVPGAKTSTLIIASGAQYQLATISKSVFTAAATAAGSTLQIDDVAPLPASDSFGTTLFYITLVFMIGGYMTGMFVGMMGGALRHRIRLSIITGVAVVIPLIVVVITRLIIGAVTANFFELWGIGFVTVIAVGVVTNGLAYFFGRFIAAAALLIFVFMTVPSSGGAIPIELVPAFFQWIHPYVAGTGTIELLRQAEYGVGPEAWQPLILLVSYIAAGAILTGIGRTWFTRRMRHAAITGKRPTMMAVAQGLAIAAGRKAAEEAAGSAQAGGVDASPRDGGDDAPHEPHVRTAVMRTVAEQDGQLHHDHRGAQGSASGGPAAAAAPAAAVE
jgi:hypothetical protein